MTPRDEVIRPGGEGASPAWRVVRIAAVVSAAAFVVGGFLTQTVIVPYWQAMEPAAFLTSFARYGPVLGATLFPIELLAVVLLGLVAYSTVRGGGPGRLVWIGALLCMIATLLLIPLYFADANNAFTSRAIADNEVAHELRSWYAWNWARVGLALLAVVLGSVGLRYRVRYTR